MYILPTTSAQRLQQPWSTTIPTLPLDFSRLQPVVRASVLVRNSKKPADSDHGRDPFRWNLNIRSFSHGSDPRGALVTLGSMLENGVVGDKYTYSLVLKACSRMGFVREGMQVHGLLSKSGLGSDLFVSNCLIGLYMRCGRHLSARLVFDRMPARDSVTYNSMIDGYVKRGWVDAGKEVFDVMPAGARNLITWNTMLSGYAGLEDGASVAWELFGEMPERDLISWNTMIHVCAECGRMEDARHLFDVMPQRDVVSWANIIDGYAKKGSIDIAADFFGKMPERDVVACNSMMAAYVQNGSAYDALEIFYSMLNDDALSPDRTTLVIALTAVAQLGCVDKGAAIHGYLDEKGFVLDGNLGVALIDMYAKCGDIEMALLVFDGIKEKDVDHWNAMIGGLSNHGRGRHAFKLLLAMKRYGVEPDHITFVAVLHGCGHSGLMKEGMICFELMRRVHKISPTIQHYGCMVDVLCRAGYLNEAQKFIQEMPIKPNEIIWRTLLCASMIQEDYRVGVPTANHLVRKYSRSATSHILLSHLYASLGLWRCAREIRTTMHERNIVKVPGRSWIELEGTIHEFTIHDSSHLQASEIQSLSMDCLLW
ncbi:hypothetical protein MLD38_018720 [Melastoma candidum]|uniref:Uncharacterized protein n=1 Tax=Melastoma candidum TaxID=119954 RepID=A0ACB9QWL4_9MYRT|nr:hypothetical protein MLD38_018720 [Melastoma candidum]